MVQSSTPEDRSVAAFPPLRLRTAADEVLAVVVDAIRGGLYAPGDMLPRERDLAERLGVSRTVVREAYAVLRRAAIVDVRRGQSGGTQLVSLTNIPSVLASVVGETRYELRSVLEVRRAVEPAAALIVARRADEAFFARLDGLVDQLGGALDDGEVFYALDVQFHLLIAAATGNEMLAGVVRDVYRRLAVLREQFPYAHVDLDVAARNQGALLDALRSRDEARVTAELDRHLAAYEERMLGAPLSPPA
ncbi:FadR/GntR family transcriptional regulator [Conexibacter woesei]|uniref:GntR domain protein n=1 Tax=Conexibacter woesei (strain DSM 14684 / CCUG 47730 / CIP 108061 / JCM 11494 / NBRC 100937 / ID131577) TaxID=469383 RepID=D3F6G4_CONWI|nr:FCD domain-containing protein [Conexibacter woesei]ADB50731.1 GntR domain protein [Conexibacter woesei DSM 14684]